MSAVIAAIIDNCAESLREEGAEALIVGVRTQQGSLTFVYGKPDRVVYMAELIKTRVLMESEVPDEDMGDNLERLV